MGKGKELDLEYFKTLLEDCQDKALEKSPEIRSKDRKAFTDACEIFHAGFEAQKNAESEEAFEEAAKGQGKAMKKCVKAATKIFEKLDMTKSVTLRNAVLQGGIVMQATPEKLASFCAEDPKNSKLIEMLFKDKDLMKAMLGNGGAKDGKYGEAMAIYAGILATFPSEEDEFTEVNKKIAMAVALELCTPMNEFDTKVPVDPQKRYEHYAEAYKNGELDPAFPHFSIWELRMVINCDAPNDQLKWGRDMMMNFCPYITCLTDFKERYSYILKTDVLMRDPHWTSSPRTYQQVLSGGGKETPNAWFGRFICRAFGIPVKECKSKGKEAFLRWTPAGWEPMMGATWETVDINGVSGFAFKGELDGRTSHSPEDYFKTLTLMENLAEVLDARRGDVPEDEKMVLHPLRLWRSLAIIQRAVMLEDVSPEKYERKGEGVKTKLEKYLEKFEISNEAEEIKTDGGTITIPPDSAVSKFGNVMVLASQTGGMQINFLADGSADFDLPDDIEPRKYKVTLEVCTVHLKQSPMFITIDHDYKTPITIPYTVGGWKSTEPIEIEVEPGQTLNFVREKPSFGVAVKKITLT